MSAQRVQRHAVFQAGYDYKLEHVKGSAIPFVDALSRLPVNFNDSIYHHNSDNFNINAIYECQGSLAEVNLAKYTREDKILFEF